MTENLEKEKVKIDWLRLALEVAKFVVSALGAAILVKCGTPV